MATFEELCITKNFPSNWVSSSVQKYTLKKILNMTKEVCDKGYRPIVEIDLDLTSLITESKPAEVLIEISNSLDSLFIQLNDFLDKKICIQIVEWLMAKWRNANHYDSLLPSYTDTGIHGYSIYITKLLIFELKIAVKSDIEDVIQKWVQETVYKNLRSDYWNRDLKSDRIASGLEFFLAELIFNGGEFVFISNRSPDMHQDSIKVIKEIIERTSKITGKAELPLFAYFGPGGSKYDEDSKKVAQQHLENNAQPDIYFGKLVDNKIVYGEAELSSSQVVVLAILDDRAESRKIMKENLTKSHEIVKKIGLNDGVISVGIATFRHVPEVSIADAEFKISTFNF